MDTTQEKPLKARLKRYFIRRYDLTYVHDELEHAIEEALDSYDLESMEKAVEAVEWVFFCEWDDSIKGFKDIWKAQQINTLLLLVEDEFEGEVPSVNEITTWTEEQREKTAQWAGAVHLRASDNNVDIPDKPDILKP